MNDVSLDDPKLILDPDVVVLDGEAWPFAFIKQISIAKGVTV